MLHALQSIDWLTLDEWQEFVEGQPDSSIFHHRKWLELLHEHYGFKIRIPSIVDNEKVRVAIPLLQTLSLRGRKKLISLPFTDYLPVLANDPQAATALCMAIANDLGSQYAAVIVRGGEPVADCKTSSRHVRHDLRTDAPLEQIEAAFASTIRRNLLKAERLKLEFTQRTDAAAIDIFYRLHVLTRKKLGIPVQSKTYFRNLHRELISSGSGFVGVVTKDHVPIAAVVLLGYHGRLTYKYAASDPAALQYRPNDWLVYNSIRFAVEAGFRVFDFGITDKQQDGLRRFKSKWGATEYDVSYSHILGEPDRNRDSGRAVRFASEVIKRSPTIVCRALGKAFYRYSQ